MKILHIAQILRGGTATHMCELLSLQAQEWGSEAIHVLAPEDQVRFLEGLEDISISTFPSSKRDLCSLWRFAKAVHRALGTLEPDIIHLHGTYAGLIGRLVARRGRHGRTPIVYCSHGWSFNMRVSPAVRTVYGFIERALASRTEAIVCISHYEHDTAVARGLPKARLVIIHNGISAAAAPVTWHATKGTPKFPLLFAGRDCRQKGFDILLEAAEGLDPREVQLIAIGPDPRPTDPEAVKAVGWLRRDELGPFYDACLAVVVPSRWEGFGLVALEAMRKGRAVIASDVDGLCDLVVPGLTGILVSANDSDALRVALSRLDPEALRDMGHQGRARFLELFTSEAMHKKVVQVYRQLLPDHVMQAGRCPQAPPRLRA